MDVVGHEAVAEKGYVELLGRVGHKIKVDLIVVFREEDPLAIHAALCDVVGTPGNTARGIRGIPEEVGRGAENSQAEIRETRGLSPRLLRACYGSWNE